jgi:predicted aminopeptidase
MENSKADRVERGIAGRFEFVAGVDARRFHEESAARRAAVDTGSNKVDKRAIQEEERLDDFLATVTDLRAQLRQERAQRKAEDKKILDDIVKTTATMKRALLEAVGGSN